MKKLVYTAVFGKHDKVYPPIEIDDDIDYLIITDSTDTVVPGWKTLIVDASNFKNPKEANLFYRALAHRYVNGYDFSLYLDGNIRVISSLKPLFNKFAESDCAIMVHRHDSRISVKEELCAIIEGKKVLNSVNALDEVISYFTDGFTDAGGLAATGVILKNHSDKKLNAAMDLWWSLFESHNTRDQLSLPYVIWKESLSVCWIEENLRGDNPFFCVYPHHYANNVNYLYAVLSAKSHDKLWARRSLVVWKRLSNLKKFLKSL